MNIPEHFQLMGKTWTVETNPLILAQNEAYGRCEYSNQTIYIHEPENHDGQSRAGREHTFCHELVHAIASTASVELEESAVDVMAGLLHQFFVTSTGSIE